MFHKTIILASKSPRRKQLLTQAGFQLEVRINEVDESYPVDIHLTEVAEYIANKKAVGNSNYLEPNKVLLTSDTIVISDLEILEKPINREAAIQMLQKLSNKTHQVITGVCLKDIHKSISFSAKSSVSVSSLNLEEIIYYIDNYKPYDKAGAYGIQEWFGHCKINSITGTYTNIMGLPVQEIYERLIKHF